ncbi:FAD-binding oxidoreductase [bacterium]|nr:FAD-binding oxidoreductase [bacterium]
MAQAFDAIVVGCGSVGVPSAYYLARKGLKVLALDRRSAVGQGENKAAIGGVRATHSDPAKILICRESLREFSTWKETHGVDIDWKPGGYCFPVYGEETEGVLKGILPLQKSYGLNIDWVDTDAIADLVPGIEREGLRGGTFSPEDGQVSPLKAAVAFERAAMELGAEFRFNEPVVAYLRDGDSITGVRTAKGEYSAPHVVLAAGADAGRHSEMLGLNIPVEPDSHEAGITMPVKEFLKPLIVDLRPGPEGKTANFYFGQVADGAIIFCYTPKELFKGDNRESLSEFLPVLARRMVSLIPRMRHLLVRRVWRGCYPMTPDGVPIVDNVGSVPGLTLAVGMCGQGFMMGPGTGMNVAELVTEGRSLLPPEVQVSLRFGRDYTGKKEALK